MLSARIGFFGGTFAPIHHGHLRLAIELKERLQLTRVLLVPSARPPHRAAPEVPAQRRLEWARLAVGDEPGLFVDDREIRRAANCSQPSYTYDTLAEIHAGQPEATLFLLLGDDAANQLHTWHRWRELFELAHLIFVERPGETSSPSSEVADFLRGCRAPSIETLQAQRAGLWLPVALPPLAISATRIRHLLHAGRSLRGLVPEAVIRSLTPKDIHELTLNENPAHDC